MIDLDTLKPGQALLLKAVVHAVEASSDEGLGKVAVDLLGPRPPFTRLAVIVGPEDIHSLLDESLPDRPPLKVGDRVRDHQGMEFTVEAEPRATDDGMVKVSLWNESLGWESDFVENLEVIPS